MDLLFCPYLDESAGLGTNISNQVCLAPLSGVQVWQSLQGERQRWKVTPSRNPNCQTLVSSTCPLKLAPFQREEFTMETVVGICPGSQENAKHIKPRGISKGGMVGPSAVKPSWPLGGITEPFLRSVFRSAAGLSESLSGSY